MKSHHGRLGALALVIALAGCGPASSGASTAASVEPSVVADPAVSAEPSVATIASASPKAPTTAFPTSAFGDVPYGKSTAVLEIGGGYLPSLAGATSDGAAAAMASDSPSLARWWHAFCAGEIVSEGTLTEMTTMHDGHGLGLYEPDPPGTVGHGGEHVGYMALAGCLPKDGLVVVVLSNDMVDTSRVAEPLVRAARSG